MYTFLLLPSCVICKIILIELPSGIYALDDLKELGKQKGWCPYFFARHLITHADIIVFNYQYLLDPKVANLVSRELEKECIVVFDEAHNIDNVCIEALSVTLDTKAVEASVRSVHRLQSKIQELKASDNARLQQEFRDLLSGLNAHGVPVAAAAHLNPTDARLAVPMPVISSDILAEAIPGSIRKAEHFVSFMKKVLLISTYREC